MVEAVETLTADEKARTLYLRLPHVIEDDKEVMSLFRDNVIVKLPRQTSRCCHVVFSTVQERTKCLKTMKNKVIDGKRLILMPLSEKSLDKTKKQLAEGKKEVHKKVAMPLKKVNTNTSLQSLFVANIPNGTDVQVIKEAFPGCTTIALLKGSQGNQRAAVLKMETPQKAAEYLKKILPAPKILENQLSIRPYKKKSQARRRKNKKSVKIMKKLENSD
ncbi:uncharacterized protein LOC117167720 [Belonocnema kinseyi]|uniref:uncharacterized protein LOC117167720 n=1 Tax=Belonocnema kinseyi TaxID=2817044 RepID=UPI00143D4518|nr:uncharacterized protein LOC117167720 [Belonocnema kinseyi]